MKTDKLHREASGDERGNRTRDGGGFPRLAED